MKAVVLGALALVTLAAVPSVASADYRDRGSRWSVSVGVASGGYNSGSFVGASYSRGWGHGGYYGGRGYYGGPVYYRPAPVYCPPPAVYVPAPVVYAPPPVVYAPPVYYQPAPVYVAPPVVYQPAPVYCPPAPVYYPQNSVSFRFSYAR